MPGLVPGIHVLTLDKKEDVDGRIKSGHDGFSLDIIMPAPLLSCLRRH